MKSAYLNVLEGENEEQEAIKKKEKELFEDSLVVGGRVMSLEEWDHLASDVPREEEVYAE